MHKGSAPATSIVAFLNLPDLSAKSQRKDVSTVLNPSIAISTPNPIFSCSSGRIVDPRRPPT